MKRILFIFSLVLIISCESPTNNGVSEENQAKFEQQIESFRTFTEGISKKDLELTMSVISDDIQWSPPVYNGGETIGYDGFVEALKGYIETFDYVQFLEGEGPNLGPALSADANTAFWSGSLYSSATPTDDPSGLRVYGVWKWKHTESGAEGGNKWYGLINFNEEGKIYGFSDYMDYHGMQVQIENYLKSSQN